MWDLPGTQWLRAAALVSFGVVAAEADTFSILSGADLTGVTEWNSVNGANMQRRLYWCALKDWRRVKGLGFLNLLLNLRWPEERADWRGTSLHGSYHKATKSCRGSLSPPAHPTRLLFTCLTEVGYR